MANLDSKIRDLVEAFVQELSTLVRQSAVERAVDALRGTAGVPAPNSPRKAKAAGRKTAATKARPNSGNRRSPRQIARTVGNVLGYIKANPGTRSEDIRKALSLSHVQTGDALRRLLERKVIKSKGERRSTTYSVA